MKYPVLRYYDVKQFEAMGKDRLEAMIAECKVRDIG